MIVKDFCKDGRGVGDFGAIATQGICIGVETLLRLRYHSLLSQNTHDQVQHL